MFLPFRDVTQNDSRLFSFIIIILITALFHPLTRIPKKRLTRTLSQLESGLKNTFDTCSQGTLFIVI